MCDRTARLRPAVFLDRDGTINHEVAYLTRREDFRLLPGAGGAIAGLRKAGYAVVVVTNQSAVARGMLTEDGLGEIHGEMERQLLEAGATVDAVYYCPHHPEVGADPYRRVCDCRKPAPGMLRQAARDLRLDPGRSVMVGDNLTDLQTGWNAGCRAVLVLTGYGEATLREMDPKARDRIDRVARDMQEAAAWIIREGEGARMGGSQDSKEARDE